MCNDIISGQHYDSSIMAFVELISVVGNQCVREWSDEGQIERDACFTPILQEIQNYAQSRVALQQIESPVVSDHRLVHDSFIVVIPSSTPDSIPYSVYSCQAWVLGDWRWKSPH